MKTKERKDLVIATKVRGNMGKGPNDSGLSRKHIIWSVENSLKRLQTDYIGSYFPISVLIYIRLIASSHLGLRNSFEGNLVDDE